MATSHFQSRFLALSVLLLGVLSAQLALTLPSAAQEFSPTRPPATPLPSPLAPQTLSADVAALPFAETFDTPLNWLPSGAWRYTPDCGYSGGCWQLDTALRQTTSVLQYTRPIDLSGTLSAQLLYRQDGYLPPSDLVTLEVSLDGGVTWNVADQQIGVKADWELHAVDLTSFRGQVVLLRYQVITGVQMPDQEPVSGFYSVDNLTIQHVDIAPELVYLAPEPRGPHTLLGLHMVVGAGREVVLDFVQRLQNAGWPLGTLKGTTGTEDILNAVAAASPSTIIVYRSLKTPWGMRDCPNTANDPVLEAQMWIAGLQPQWQGVQADYFEIMNECLPSAEWLTAFSIEAMRQAERFGQCLLLFSFSPGRPEPDYFLQLKPVFEYALEHPCASGRYHGVALHVAGRDAYTLATDSGVAMGLRHRLLYGALLQELPEAVQIPVYLTEAGPGDGRVLFPCSEITREALQFTQQLEYDPYVRGFHLWNVGAGANEWADITPCLPQLADALISYYQGR